MDDKAPKNSQNLGLKMQGLRITLSLEFRFFVSFRRIHVSYTVHLSQNFSTYVSSDLEAREDIPLLPLSQFLH